ncbi:FG-GAP repeat domain-containing protein [Elusimicrobiota bacterium]
MIKQKVPIIPKTRVLLKSVILAFSAIVFCIFFQIQTLEASFSLAVSSMGTVEGNAYSDYPEAAWGDYDSDGDLDVAVCGLMVNCSSWDTIAAVDIYRNDGSSTFTRIELSSGDTGLRSGSLDWGDYDNDGDLDLIACGLLGDSDDNAELHIYTNNAEVFSGQIIPVEGNLNPYKGDVRWGDYNNDGWLDFAITGEDANSSYGGITRIYKNCYDEYSSERTFVLTNVDLVGVGLGSIAWGDYNNDGYLDLAISGRQDYWHSYLYIYKNNSGVIGGSDYIRKYGGYQGDLAWGDYDSDGDLDIAVSGNYYYNKKTLIYTNDSGSFSQTHDFIGLDYASITWGDYDNDGWLDLAVIGDVSYYGATTRIYRNDHAGGFEDELNLGIENFRNGCIRFGDYDNDNDLDLLVIGQAYSGYQYKAKADIYENDGVVENSVPNAPSSGFSLEYSSSTGLEFRWDAGSDAGVFYPQGLNYDIRIASIPTTDGVGNWLVTSGAGKGKTPFVGNCFHGYISSSPLQLGYRLSAESFINNTTYYWQVGTVDSGLLRSSWSAMQSRHFDIYKPAAIEVLTAYPGAAEGSIDLRWLTPSDDYNSESPFSTGGVYAVQRSTSSEGPWSKDLAQTVAPIKVFSSGTPAYHTITGLEVDVDHYFKIWCADEGTDGESPNWSDESIIAVSVAQVHTFLESSVSIHGARFGSLAWGDYDNDGDLDLIVGGEESFMLSKLRIYRNDGSGDFNDIGANIEELSHGDVSWGDYDNDGDLDFIACGRAFIGNYTTKLYLNNNGTFIEDTNSSIIGVRDASSEWGDYDNDGDLDLVICGTTGTGEDDRVTKIYRNDEGIFNDIFVNLPNVSHGDLALGDYDEDGDLDLALCGNTDSSKLTRIYRNEGNGEFVDIESNVSGDEVMGERCFGMV